MGLLTDIKPDDYFLDYHTRSKHVLYENYTIVILGWLPGTMAATSDKSEMLFACTNCHRRCKFEELSANQQLCKVRHLSTPL